MVVQNTDSVFSIPVSHVSDTAFLVAAYRLAESKRPDRYFDDSIAEKLLGSKGAEMLQLFPHWKMGEWMMAVRTVIIDRAVTKLISEGVDTIVNLAAGLDTRPYRMDLPESLTWIEADYAGVTNYKNEVLASDKPKCKLKRVSVDLANPAERDALFASIMNLGNVAVITEGLLLYLEEKDVLSLSEHLYDLPNLRAWITDMTTKKAFEAMRGLSPMNSSESAKSVQFKFLPDSGIRYFEPLGWRVEAVYNFLEYGESLNRGLPEGLEGVDNAFFKEILIGVLSKA